MINRAGSFGYAGTHGPSSLFSEQRIACSVLQEWRNELLAKARSFASLRMTWKRLFSGWFVVWEGEVERDRHFFAPEGLRRTGRYKKTGPRIKTFRGLRCATKGERQDSETTSGSVLRFVSNPPSLALRRGKPAWRCCAPRVFWSRRFRAATKILDPG